ncbi:Bgt-51820 [Blumeria graminis f. sp. tritici]|uniref:Bgt-51820 n=1 Tax=Blumeria graminis f. sp. tritici TaxID=62690 RepID=A0A9X9MH51_BLUGR|nr:Bgt-51820 [Blumeria graminis f. sp. tritici]
MFYRFRFSDIRSIDRTHPKLDQAYISQHWLQKPAVTVHHIFILMILD